MSELLDNAINFLLRRGAPLPKRTAEAARRSIEKFAGVVSDRTVEELTTTLFDGLREVVQPDGRTGADEVRNRLQLLLNRYDEPQAIAGAMNLEFKIDTAERVMRGAGRFVSDQADVDEYPAWELHRVFDRAVPRGFREGPGGVLIPVADDDWPARFQAAAEESGDTEAARVLAETGRMVALKSSGLWQALGNGAGGYDDTLGNPFAPFAFNSGFRTDGLPRLECIELGLLRTDEKPQPTPFKVDELISLPE